VIVRAAEHAPKLELGEQLVGLREAGPRFEDAVRVVLFAGEIVELATLFERPRDRVDVVDDLLGGGLLAQSLLRPLVVRPKGRIGGRLLVLF
jgi:hypothetical protein